MFVFSIEDALRGGGEGSRAGEVSCVCCTAALVVSKGLRLPAQKPFANSQSFPDGKLCSNSCSLESPLERGDSLLLRQPHPLRNLKAR